MSTSDQNTTVASAPRAALNEYGLRQGYELGSWIIEAQLGFGGFAITYLAKHRYISAKRVAIKEYLPEGTAIRNSYSRVRAISKRQEEIYTWGLQRFLEEAQLLSKFKHDNIVEVQDYFEKNNTAYIVMDYVRGHSIQELVDGGDVFDEQRLRDITYPLLNALRTLHSSNVFHRDITPSNVLIRDDGLPVLIDFGSARYAMRARGSVGHRMTVVYTPGYAPIEQQEQTQQGPYTDIYAMGATLYYAAFHQRPVEATTRSGDIRMGAGDPLVPASEKGKGRFSVAFLSALDAALRLNATKRPRSIEAWLAIFGEPPREGLAAPPAPPAPGLFTSRVGWVAAGAAVVLVTSAVVGAWLLSPPPLDINDVPGILSRAATELTVDSLDAPTIARVRDLYLEVLNVDRENARALAGYSATNALRRFKAAIASEQLTEAEDALWKAQHELSKADISAEALQPAWAQLEAVRTFIKVRPMLQERPLAPETWTQAQQLLLDIAAIEGEESRAQSGLGALTALKATQLAIDQKRFAAARARIEEAEAALAELGIDELPTARKALAAAAQWEKEQQAQIAQGLATAQRALSRGPLTQTRLSEGRVAYNGVLAVQPGEGRAQAGLVMVEKLGQMLAGVEAQAFAPAEKALAEARIYARAAGLEADLLASAQDQLTRAKAAWQAEQRQQRIQQFLTQASQALAEGPLSEAMLAKAEGFYQEVDKFETQHEAALAGFEVVSLLRATKAQADHHAFAESRNSLKQVKDKLAEAQLQDLVVERAAQSLTGAEVDWRLHEAATVLSAELLAEDRLDVAKAHYEAIVLLRADHPRATAGLDAVAVLHQVASARKSRDYTQARSQLADAKVRFAEAGLGVGPLETLTQQIERDERVRQTVLRERAIAKGLSQAIGTLLSEPFSEVAWARAKKLLAEVSAIEGGESRTQAGLRALAALEASQAAIDQKRFAAAHARIEEAEAAFAAFGIGGLGTARAELASAIEQAEAEQRRARIRQMLAQAAEWLKEAPLNEATLVKAEGLYQEVDRLEAQHEVALAGFEVVSLLRATKAQAERQEFAESRNSLQEVKNKLADAQLEDLVVERATQRVTEAEVDWRLREAMASLSAELLAEDRLDLAKAHYDAILVLRAAHPRAMAGLQAVAALHQVVSARKKRDYTQARSQLADAKARFADAGLDVGLIEILTQQTENEERVLRERAIAKRLSQAIGALLGEPFLEHAWARAKKLFAEVSAIEGGEPGAQAGLNALAALEAAQGAIDDKDFATARSHIARAETEFARLGVRHALDGAYEAVEAQLDQAVGHQLDLARQSLAERPLSEDALLRAKSAFDKALTLAPDQPIALAGADIAAAILDAREAITSKAYARAETRLVEARERLHAQQIDEAPPPPELGGAIDQLTEELLERTSSGEI